MDRELPLITDIMAQLPPEVLEHVCRESRILDLMQLRMCNKRTRVVLDSYVVRALRAIENTSGTTCPFDAYQELHVHESVHGSHLSPYNHDKVRTYIHNHMDDFDSMVRVCATYPGYAAVIMANELPRRQSHADKLFESACEQAGANSDLVKSKERLRWYLQFYTSDTPYRERAALAFNPVVTDLMIEEHGIRVDSGLLYSMVRAFRLSPFLHLVKTGRIATHMLYDTLADYVYSERRPFIEWLVHKVIAFNEADFDEVIGLVWTTDRNREGKGISASAAVSWLMEQPGSKKWKKKWGQHNCDGCYQPIVYNILKHHTRSSEFQVAQSVLHIASAHILSFHSERDNSVDSIGQLVDYLGSLRPQPSWIRPLEAISREIQAVLEYK